VGAPAGPGWSLHKEPIGTVRGLALRPTFAFLSEYYPAGGVDLEMAPVPRPALSGEVDLIGPYIPRGNLSYLDYTLVDRQAPDSRHHRDEFQGALTLGRWFELDAVQIAATGGYWGRLVSVANNYPASLVAPYASSPSQLFHGPVLAGDVRLGLLPGLSLGLGAQMQPYLFASGDASVAAIGPLFGYGFAPGLAWRPWPGLVLDLGYRYEFTTGYNNDYIHTQHGPSAGITWRF
jgi:hypothetical protein